MTSLKPIAAAFLLGLLIAAASAEAKDEPMKPSGAMQAVMDDSVKDFFETADEAVSLFDESAKKSADQDVKAFATKTLPILQHHGSMAERLPKS